jgi:hypothetical protein
MVGASPRLAIEIYKRKQLRSASMNDAIANLLVLTLTPLLAEATGNSQLQELQN